MVNCYNIDSKFCIFPKDTTISLKNNTNNLVEWNTDFNFTTNGLNQSFLNSFTKVAIFQIMLKIIGLI